LTDGQSVWLKTGDSPAELASRVASVFLASLLHLEESGDVSVTQDVSAMPKGPKSKTGKQTSSDESKHETVDYGRATWNSRSSAGTAGWSEIFSPGVWRDARFSGFHHDNSDNEDVRALSRKWAEAELGGDADWLDDLLLDDFVAVGPRGTILTKQQWLDRHRSGTLKYQQFDWRELHVRVHDDMALVLGCEQTLASCDGRSTTTPALRVLQVFTRVEDRWKMAAIQHSPIVGEYEIDRG